MYKFQIQGCLPVLLILGLLLFIALKLWFLIAIVVFIYLIKNFIAKLNINIELKKKEKEANYAPNKGEVYKVCPVCGKNVKRSAEKCPNCGSDL
ncbi:MAG: zinc ribbon domain-containing protein [Candidatus Gastranaerophilales bacterium]|nr:zinc ribbon domain-containing protein [Candidatus Gastranaerophilales bacterium]